MPTGHIISRIKNIEERITAIQNIGNISSKKTEKTTTQQPQKDSFSSILNEVLQSQNQNQLNLLGDTTATSTTTTLLENKTDSLLEQYKTTGIIPTAQAKPIPNKQITSTNPGTWDHIINQAATKANIDPKLIHAVIQAESAYNPNAVSIAGAEGLMQLMPYTAKRIGVTNSFDPEQNIVGGATVLKEMLTRYDGDLIKSIAAYNAGPDAVDRANGIPRYKETQEYVPRVLNYYYNMNYK